MAEGGYVAEETRDVCILSLGAHQGFCRGKEVVRMNGCWEVMKLERTDCLFHFGRSILGFRARTHRQARWGSRPCSPARFLVRMDEQPLEGFSKFDVM